MAARDRWTVDLNCPKCGKTGEVTFSEDDHPYMKDDTLSIDGLSAGFDVREYGKTSIATSIQCSDCKELAK